MAEDFDNHRRVFDSGDDLQGAATVQGMINQELGEPFRRDAMKKPVVVAGISKGDMRPQKGA